MKYNCQCCGKPAHPCYVYRCEDCWVDAQISKTSERRPKRPPQPYNPIARLFKKEAS